MLFCKLSRYLKKNFKNVMGLFDYGSTTVLISLRMLFRTGPKQRHLSTANDDSELVPNEELSNVDNPDSDSDTDSIPDLSTERGLRFHLKKKSKEIHK